MRGLQMNARFGVFQLQCAAVPHAFQASIFVAQRAATAAPLGSMLSSTV